MAAKRYELSAWDRLRLLRDKAGQLVLNIDAMRAEQQLPILSEIMGGMLGEMCQLHIELREMATTIAAKAEKAEAQGNGVAAAKRN